MRSLRTGRIIGLLLLISVVSSCGGGGGTSSSGKTNVHRAYVANSGAKTVTGYTIDQTSGALTSTGTTTVGNLPDSVVADPQGRFAYVANTLDNTVSAFTINARTGELTSAGTATTGGNTIYVNADPLSRFLYATNWNTNDVTVFTINASSGALTKMDCGGGTGCGVSNPGNFAVGTTPYSNTAFDLAGKFAYLAIQGDNAVARFAIDQTTGALSSKVTATTGTAPTYVAIDPAGKFAYVANTTSNDVSAYVISAADGTLAQIDCGGGAGCNGKNFAAGAYPNSIAIDPAGKLLYVANANANTVSAYTINGTSGALTTVSGSPYSVGPSAYGSLSVATDPAGKFLYATSNQTHSVTGFVINGTTGQLTPLAGSPFAAGLNAGFISTTVTSY